MSARERSRLLKEADSASTLARPEMVMAAAAVGIMDCLERDRTARRDAFAAAALTGLLASTNPELRIPPTFEEYAACAVHHADALLAALDAEAAHA